MHIALWNSIVGKDDLVFYIGDFCDGTDHDLQEIRSQWTRFEKKKKDKEQ